MGGDNETKNLILAAVLSMAVIFAWRARLGLPDLTLEPVTTEGTAAEGAAAPGTAAPATAGATAAPAAVQPAGEAVTASPRVRIETKAISGSIALVGGRLDDLHLSEYRVSLEPGADTVVLLRPADGEEPYFVDYGWLPDTGTAGPLPNSATEWRVESGDKLTEQWIATANNRGIDGQAIGKARLTGQMTQDTFGRGRTADIAHADE